MSLEFYRTPVDLSAAGAQTDLLDDLPRDVAGLAKIVQGVLMHEHIAPAYGLTLSAAKHAEAHVRPVETMLERIVAGDPRPLSVARPESERFVCVCRHFTLMHVAMLRHQGVPARARCGFGAYFEKGKFLDHWVTEYWNADRNRWTMVDAQIDARQREIFKIDFDLLDVPREKFLVAGDAWRLVRAGKADPEAFGILDMWGAWFIASNIVRDVAALNNREMLPWDVWGVMQPKDEGLDLAFFDRLAGLTHEPDAHFEELRSVYREQRIAVPQIVFNAVLNRPEAA